MRKNHLLKIEKMKNKIFLHHLKVVTTFIFVIFLAIWLVFNWYSYFVISNEVSLAEGYLGSGRFLILLFLSALLTGILFFTGDVILKNINNERIVPILLFMSFASWIIFFQSIISTLGGGLWWFALSVPAGIGVISSIIFFESFKEGNH